MKTIESTTTRLISKAAYSILILYIITSVHHIYGGLVDADPKRLFVPLLAAVPLGLTQWALHVYRRTGSGAALTWFSVLTVFWWVGIQGLLHGAYAHAYKDLIYLAGVPASEAHRYYYNLNPTEHYPPDHLFFELTGVLEFVTAYFIALYTLRLNQDRQKANRRASVPGQAVSS